MLRLKNIPVFLSLIIAVLIAGLWSCSVLAEETVIKGNAFYRERMALPPNAVFEAVLEDISLADAPAPVLGRDIVDPAGQVPIAFEITYNADEIKNRHRYNVRGRITVDGQLMFITDTIHPVLTDTDQGEVQLMMKLIQRSPQ